MWSPLELRTGAKGVTVLGIRGETCNRCGTAHDALFTPPKAILARERVGLAAKIPALPAPSAAAVG